MNELIIAGEHTNVFSTFTANTNEEKAALFNAVTNCTNRIADHINEVISVSNFYIEMVELANEETGEITNVPRTIIFDEHNNGYVACSFGFYNALCKLVGIFGMPQDWEKPIKIKIKQVHKGNNNILTFTIEK